jgi:hypothetical protein
MRDAVEAGKRLDDGVELLAGHARRRQRRDDFDVVFAPMFGDVLNEVRGGLVPIEYWSADAVRDIARAIAANGARRLAS